MSKVIRLSKDRDSFRHTGRVDILYISVAVNSPSWVGETLRRAGMSTEAVAAMKTAQRWADMSTGLVAAMKRTESECWEDMMKILLVVKTT